MRRRLLSILHELYFVISRASGASARCVQGPAAPKCLQNAAQAQLLMHGYRYIMCAIYFYQPRRRHLHAEFAACARARLRFSPCRHQAAAAAAAACSASASARARARSSCGGAGGRGG